MHELKRVQTDYRDAEKAKDDARRSNIWNFIVRFCEEIESGLRRNGSERYTSGSLKAGTASKICMIDLNLAIAIHGNILTGHLPTGSWLFLKRIIT